MTGNMLLWILDAVAGFDSAWVFLDGDRLRAEGQQSGLVPVPYWVHYRLETGPNFVTTRMTVESRWEGGGSASLDLARANEGKWTVDGAPRPDLGDALDVDLAACPLTNTMPIRRHDLHLGGAEGGNAMREFDFLMAFVEVPRLRVVPSRQHYTYLRESEGNGGDAVVRYRSMSFQSELVVDADGFVVEYPLLGRRVVPPPPDLRL
jgi:uncharacterized protein